MFFKLKRKVDLGLRGSSGVEGPTSMCEDLGVVEGVRESV